MQTATRTRVRSGVLHAILALCLTTGSSLWAQTTNTPLASDKEVIVLDPFSVTAEVEGYKAVDTLGGSRVQTKLKDTPSAISVVTKAFLDDLGIRNAQDLYIYTTNTEVAGLNGNFSGVAARGVGVGGNAEAGRLLNPAGTNRSRGLTAMDSTRNYFLSEIPWDSFNIDRIDISRGPNSFLFGVGSPSGISNYSTNGAIFKDKGSLELRGGSFGSTRESLDYNKILIPDELAVRIDLLNDDTRYQQDPAYNHAKRGYAALRYEPKALNNGSSHLKIQVNAEKGRVRSNNPRMLPPLDFITGYFAGGQLNKAGYDPFLYSGQQLAGVGSFITLSPWVNGQDYHYIWPGPGAAFSYDAKTGNMLQAMTTLNGANGNPAISLPQAMALYTSGFANYARTVNFRTLVNGADTAASQYHGAYAGTVTYNDKSLTDPSIFDFYNKLVDGTNKQEWQNWNAFNLTVQETMFDGRFAVQAVVDHQEFDQGQAGIFGYTQPFISVDLDAYLIKSPTWLGNATPNPNAGRAFLASDFGSGDNSAHYTHENYQLTANGDLRAEDFLQKNDLLTRILGHHSITGLAGSYKTKSEYRTWSGYATDTTFGNLMGDPLGKINANRAISWVSYIGPSMTTRSSASGLGLSNIVNPISPISGTIQHFIPQWNAPNVNPAAPWADPAPTPGGTNSNTQAANPANYVGWTSVPVNVLNWHDNIDELYQSGNKTEQKLKSVAFMYQGHLWDDTIIPTFGWRRDTITQRSANAPLDPNTAVASMNYGITAEGAKVETTSKSYGVTLHLPPSMRGKLPLDTDVSVYYFHGANETPRVRYAFDASQLPNEIGKTDDYGVQVDTLNGRATIRLTYFKTIDQNAQGGSGAADPLGNNGYYLYLLPAWGAANAAASGKAVAAWPAAIDDWGYTSHPDDAQNSIHNAQVAAVNDWRTNFAKFFPQSFFDAYGLGVNVNAITTGNWNNVYNQPNASPITFPWNIANTGGGRINGSFPVITQDIESKGYELEVTVRPVSNWDLTFNASKVEATQTALGPENSAFIEKQYEFFKGPAGQLPLWGFWGGGVDTSGSTYRIQSGGTLYTSFMQNIWSAYQLQKAQTGTMQPELSKWNFKAVTNYTFKKGTFKGVNVGGGFRWASKPILGYGISEFTDPTGAKSWIMDVKKPLYGKIDTHFDAWIGYQRALTAKIDWRLQLNLRNVGESAHLVPVSVEPDGSWAVRRIQSGMTWEVSSKLMF